MKTLLVQFKHAGPPPSLEEVRNLFGLGAQEIDTSFGVVATDPAAGLYTVMVDSEAGDRVKTALAGRPPDPAEGVFSNPTIEPFGPPED